MKAVRNFARPDERQFVFIIRTSGGFAIVETAELWEEPEESGAGASYFCYPTVIGFERFAEEDQAVKTVRARYPWCSDQ